MQENVLSIIEEINTRQDEAIRQIDDLNQRIESLIGLYTATAKAEMERHAGQPVETADQQPADESQIELRKSA